MITKLWQDPGEENLAIAREIQLYLQSGVRPGDIAVLYRTNAGPRFLMEKLMEYNLPFRTRDTVPNLYEHWISRNILTYIRIAMGSRAREDILQVINRPKRYISRDAMPDETVSFEKMKAFYVDKDWIAERIESLEGDLRAIARMSPLAAVNYIRQGMGYDEYLIEYAAFRRMRPEELLETADELKESAAGFKTFDEWFAHIEAYKEELLRQAAQYFLLILHRTSRRSLCSLLLRQCFQRQHKHKPKYRAYQRNDECHFHALCDTEHTDDQRINRRTDRGTKVLANLNHRIALHSARGRNLELRRNCKGNTDRAGRS